MDTTTWASKYDRAAMDFLAGEHVLCATSCTRTGGWQSMGVGAVSPLLGSVLNRRSKSAAGKLPQMFLLAVTDTDVVALKLPTSSLGRTPRATKELLRIPREGLSVTSEPVFMGTKMVLTRGEDTIAIQGAEGELTDRVLRALEA
jgi:hypothetical protein